jgi:Zn-dependent alcohol dehydrogenase
MTSAQRVVFPARNSVELEPFELGAPGEDEVEVRTTCSLISTGTEGIVLGQDFGPTRAGPITGRLPFYRGYAAVGIVERTGSRVTSPTRGDVISHRFAPEDVAEAYALTATRRGESMGVLFDWTRRADGHA